MTVSWLGSEGNLLTEFLSNSILIRKNVLDILIV